MRLGDKVRVKVPIKRYRAYGSGNTREWERDKYPAGDWPAEGYLMGLRNLSNGTVDWHPDDYGGGYADYKPREYFKAALVAIDLRRKPILAFIEDVEAIE